jgi:formamidopyrimidine-DNA glycosylase
MPELPEVETVKIGLAKLLPGLEVSRITSDWAKSFPNDPEIVSRFVLGSKIDSISRRGKGLIISLDSGYSLLIHLKMTGQLVYRGEENFGAGHPNDSLVGKLPDKSTRVIIEFKNDAKLFFNDQRKFGWIRIMPTIELVNDKFINSLGPEPLDKEFSLDTFKRRLLKRKKSVIKSVLLDQKVIAGIGNIYADESLWLAKIHPLESVEDISENKLKLLHEAIIFVLKLSIEKGGSTDKNYVDAYGNKGSYLKFANVFRREGQACPRCGHDIIKIRVAGRGTHICPNCQRKIKR